MNIDKIQQYIIKYLLFDLFVNKIFIVKNCIVFIFIYFEIGLVIFSDWWRLKDSGVVMLWVYIFGLIIGGIEKKLINIYQIILFFRLLYCLFNCQKREKRDWCVKNKL